MILKPYSYAGTSLQSATFKASFPQENGLSQITASPRYVARAGAVPVYAGKDYNPHTLTLNIVMPSVLSDLDTLNTLFDTKDETPQQFICTDTEDSDKQYYVYATPQQVFGGHDGTQATVVLALDDPIWQTVTQNSQTWTITSSTSTTDVTINGNDDSYPIFEITPTSSPSTDFIYSAFLQVLPTSTNPWTDRPLQITGATDTTWDTAAIVAAGKMRSDGGDIRVYRNGSAVNFWLSGVNTTDTKVWVVADMPGARNMTLKTALGTGSVTEIEITYTDTNLTYIQDMPNEGLLILDTALGTTDTEEFKYTSKTITDTKLAFTISTRALRNTVAVAHSAGCFVRHLPYNYRISYGNATASAPTVDDTTKPLVTLSTSSNASFVYASFWDVGVSKRSGRWEPFIHQISDAAFGLSNVYTSTSDEGDTDPATEMGLTARTFQREGTWRSDTVHFSWLGSFPDYVTSFSASGEQIQTASTIPTFGMSYWGRAGLANWLWTINAQATTDYGTWTAWSKATTDSTVPISLDHLRWTMKGTISGTSDLYAKAGPTSVTVNLTNYPHVMIRSEITSAVLVNCTIANTTTGESFNLLIPVQTNETVYVDGDPDFPTVTHNGAIVNGAIKLSTIRSAWLKLQPGSNSLTFDNLQSVSSNYTIAIKWRDRASFF